MKQISSNLILHGLVMLALAALFFVHPNLATFSIAFVPGVVLIAGGVIVFLTRRDRSTDSIVWSIVLAVLMVAAGMALILWPKILVVLVGLVLLAEGIDKLDVVLRLRKRGLKCRVWTFLPAALSIVAGLFAVLPRLGSLRPWEFVWGSASCPPRWVA